MSSSIEDGKGLFDALIAIIHDQRVLIETMAAKLEQLEVGQGGGGSGNGFEVYETHKVYNRYQALIDPDTDTPYLVVPAEGDTYISTTVEEDCENGNLRLLGFDGQIVTFNHTPTQPEIDRLPEKVIVVEYNEMDTPYTGILSNDNTD